MYFFAKINVICHFEILKCTLCQIILPQSFLRAIELEPLLLDAYWHRHLLFILQDKKKEALEDLTFILKHTKTHAGAYRSMAEIYKKQDDITMAIVNYTQAIKLNPRDHEAYFARAECYEKVCNRLILGVQLQKVTSCGNGFSSNTTLGRKTIYMYFSIDCNFLKYCKIYPHVTCSYPGVKCFFFNRMLNISVTIYIQSMLCEKKEQKIAIFHLNEW